ncbi:Glycosyltransferase, family GT90 [Paramicrosporidium saccamoebae]|uniref:Glycosyltransferase, family GT90 n=1 Tax=Paramicrosporidium saccamoebae TaxID=1246581 RepID=A0A2H9TGM2_9FUNG|nr:Glycosyltransferase, family GT90 [Paramicrosporidium saccamoebae]
MMAVGDNPRNLTAVWQNVQLDSTGRMIGTVDKARDVLWAEVGMDKASWPDADRILKESFDPQDECDDPVLLVAKSRCRSKKYAQYHKANALPSLNQCPYELVELANRFFSELGEQLFKGDTIDAIYASDDPFDALFMYRIQYDAHLLFTDATILAPPTGTLEHERLNRTLQRIATVQNYFKATNFEFALSLSTLPLCMRKEQSLNQSARNGWYNLRYLSMTRCDDTITLPILEWTDSYYGPFENWDYKMDLFTKATKNVPWKERKDQAAFQGVLTDTTCDAKEHVTFGLSDCLTRGRGRLLKFSKDHPELLAVFFTGQPAGWNCVNSTTIKSPVEMATGYRYIILTDTQCGWTPELRQYLFSGSTVLLQSSPCKEYYQFLLKPWVHYVPWEYETLTDRLLWVRQNPEKAHMIAQNALQFAQRFLTQEAMMLWDVLVLGRAATSAHQQSIRLAALTERLVTGFEPIEDDQGIIKF